MNFFFAVNKTIWVPKKKNQHWFALRTRPTCSHCFFCDSLSANSTVFCKLSWYEHNNLKEGWHITLEFWNLAMGVFGRGAVSRISIRSIHLRNTTNFVVPENYKPNRSLLKQLPWKAGLDIWWKSLSPNRLSDLQKDLVEFMLPSHLQENQRIIKEFKKNNYRRQGQLYQWGRVQDYKQQR